MDTLHIGEITATWLRGGNTHLDGGAMFGVVPKALWSRKYEHNDTNQIHLRTDPILLQTKSGNMLIDSGIGNGKMNEKMKRNQGVTEESSIEASLAELGLTPADIHFVLMTHLHFDHASGLTKWTGDTLVPTFPNAKIYVSKTEWEEMRQPNIRSRNTYWKENWEPIQHQVHTFAKELYVTEQVRMVHTGGHSDGHAIIIVKDREDTLLHMGDIMPTHAHQNPLWVMAYDDYPMTSIYQKQEWVDWGIKENAWFTFYHDSYYRAVKWDETGNMIEKIEREKNKKLL
ncbi:YtnP family quorum-quenching lactonase [Ectobacillus panaciterrae]|uniref:YtnP family quorum-quenching lactonase n=1 Tax=Ectobacillus panaciterrae TaxID=363872 RepID=UPI000407597D|nr:MBL fold metallo-hydrolase [Ectobacillus panaciterrae]